MASIDRVAIIGAGLSGLTLALALHKQSIPCTLYEARASALNIGGAIMLCPNGLRILDYLGVYKRIRPEGYEFDKLYFRSPDDQPMDTYEFGGIEQYGYRAMRIYRHILIRELSAMVREAGIPIEYHKKFVRVLAETEKDITWEFSDGSTATATCVVGADGIHSRVRKYLYPDLEPAFTKMVIVAAAVPTSQLQVPTSYSLPVTIMNKQHGAVFIAPQLGDGSEVMVGRQKRSEQQLTREGWDELLNNKEWCVEFLRQGADDFPEIVQRAVSDIAQEKIFLWPLSIVPKLETWTSKHCRVVIVGDAAHAIPPAAGQGVNQAFEDVFTYSLVLARSDKDSLERSLKVWQDRRQERVDKVLALNAYMDRRRMPSLGEEKEAEDAPLDFESLYKPDFVEMVDAWLSRHDSH
jgi:2-polyprenyl-6-methoxyphenol hydroxylase-like FAD-dependent oxidoreductase